MIGNKLLTKLYEMGNENYAISELGEIFKLDIKTFKKDLKECNLEKITEEERVFLAKVSCFVFLKLNETTIKKFEWLLDDRLRLEKPFVFGARRKDEWWFLTMVKAPSIMKYKQVYFDMYALERV